MAKKYIDAQWHYPQKGEYPVIYGEYEHKDYPQIPCLVFYHGMYGVRFWNCTEEWWDDEECDDFYCSKEEVERWMYIDSLQQEQPCDTCTNDKGCVTCKDGELWEGMEQPSEDLEREIAIAIYEMDGTGKIHLVKEEELYDFAHHFYELGKHGKEPVSEDLEEAAKQYHERIQFSSRPSFYDAFIAGAEWQKEQKTIRTRYKTRLDCYEQGRQDMREEMMKDAVEAVVQKTYKYGSTMEIVTEVPKEGGFKKGDQARIIIVKED